MRIAIISDIHGNYPALQAVLADLEQQGPIDLVIGGGDFANLGAYPHECVDEVISRGWQCVRGNGEEWIVQVATNGARPAGGDPPPPEMNDVQRTGFAWTVEQLSADDIAWLAGLPLQVEVVGPSGQKLVFVHATPTSTHPVIKPDAPEEVFAQMIGATDADAFVYGHIHKAFVRELGDKLVACAGAVGFPLDQDWRPCYMLADDTGEGWSLAHRRVEYDRKQYFADLERLEVPNAAAHIELITKAWQP